MFDKALFDQIVFDGEVEAEEAVVKDIIQEGIIAFPR